MHCFQGAAAADKLPATPTSAYRPGAFDGSSAGAGLPVQAPMPGKPAKKWFSFSKGSKSKYANLSPVTSPSFPLRVMYQPSHWDGRKAAWAGVRLRTFCGLYEGHV